MPKVSEAFGGAYLRGEQFNGQPRTYIIEGWDTEMIYGKEECVLYLVGEKKRLKLTTPLANDIAEFLGDDMEAWQDHSVELYPEQKTISDRDTQADKRITMIRARPPSTPATSRAAPPKPAPKSTATAKRPDLDDDSPPF
jgi:hypothetical protein